MPIESVMVDTREPAWVHGLTFGGAPVAPALLDAGDAWVACGDQVLLIVERKTPSDLLHSIRDDRLFGQVAAMRRFTAHAYVVVTGELRPGAHDGVWIEAKPGVPLETGWKFSAVQGALLTIQELGAHVLSCHGDQEYEATVVRLANRRRTPVRLAPARDVTVLDEREALLASLPGIGPERARALLGHCGSPAWALEWLTDTQHRGGGIAGVGPATKDRVRRLLGVPDDLMLAVCGTDERPILPAGERGAVA